MSKKNKECLVSLCNRLTRNGKILTVEWNGGNDEGSYEMKVDDKTVSNDCQHPVIKLVADHMDYGGFAGDFYTTGQVTYNRETRCFEGTDEYGQSDIDTMNCHIEMRVPHDIWFDQLTVQIEADDTEVEEVQVRLVVKNGPRIEKHDEVEKGMAIKIKAQVLEQMANIEKLESIWDNIRVDRHSMEQEADNLLYVIKELSYSYPTSTEKSILIPLNTKN